MSRKPLEYGEAGKQRSYESEEDSVRGSGYHSVSQGGRDRHADCQGRTGGHGERDRQLSVAGREECGAKSAWQQGSQPYVGVIHRLDQPVEGVLVLAKHKKAAARLSRQIAEDETEKYYYAIVCGQGYEKQGDLEDYLLKDGRTNTSSVVSPEVKDARLARLHYEILVEQDAPAAAGPRKMSKDTMIMKDREAETALQVLRKAEPGAGNWRLPESACIPADITRSACRCAMQV